MSDVIRLMRIPCESCGQYPATQVVRFGRVRFKVCRICRGLANGKGAA